MPSRAVLFLFLVLISAPGFALTGWEPVTVSADAVPQIHPLPSLRERFHLVR